MSFFMAICLGNRVFAVQRVPITEVRRPHKAAPEGRKPLIFRSPRSFRTFSPRMRIPPPVTVKPNGQNQTPLSSSATEAERQARVWLQPLLALKPYLLRYRGVIGAALVALIVSAAATLVLPLAVRRMIDVGFSGMEPG